MFDSEALPNKRLRGYLATRSSSLPRNSEKERDLAISSTTIEVLQVSVQGSFEAIFML